MKRIVTAVAVVLAVVMLAGCGLDLVKFAAEQRALQIERQKSRVLLNGMIVEPPYNPVLASENKAGFYVNLANTSVTPNVTVKIFPGNGTTNQERAQKYLDQLNKDLDLGMLIIMDAPNIDYMMKPLAKLDELKAIAESSKTEAQKISELNGMGVGFMPGNSKNFLEEYKKYKEFKAAQAAEEKKKAEAEAAAQTTVPAAK